MLFGWRYKSHDEPLLWVGLAKRLGIAGKPHGHRLSFADVAKPNAHKYRISHHGGTHY
jgi:hypothetical protein